MTWLLLALLAFAAFWVAGTRVVFLLPEGLLAALWEPVAWTRRSLRPQSRALSARSRSLLPWPREGPARGDEPYPDGPGEGCLRKTGKAGVSRHGRNDVRASTGFRNRL
jgi:hypothetical protein